MKKKDCEGFVEVWTSPEVRFWVLLGPRSSINDILNVHAKRFLSKSADACLRWLIKTLVNFGKNRSTLILLLKLLTEFFTTLTLIKNNNERSESLDWRENLDRYESLGLWPITSALTSIYCNDSRVSLNDALNDKVKVTVRKALITVFNSPGFPGPAERHYKTKTVKRQCKSMTVEAGRIETKSLIISRKIEGKKKKKDAVKDIHKISVISLPKAFRLACGYERLLLLRGGDVEVNPGPDLGSSGTNDQQKRKVNPPIKVTSYNVRGLSDERKLRHLLNFCAKQNTGKDVDYICCLQETFVSDVGKIPYIWRGNYQLTGGTGQSCGCVTLLSAHLNVVESRNIDNRAHAIDCQKSNSNKISYIIANIYAPNPNTREKTEFFEKVLDTILEMQDNHNCMTTFLVGDFNLIFNPWEAKNRNHSAQEQRVASAVKDLYQAAGLVDIWDKYKGFTWRRPNSNIFSTIDRILYSTDTLKVLKLQDYWSLSCSDHAAIEANFESAENKVRVKTRISRLDPSIVKNKDLKEELEKGFNEMMSMALETWDPHLKLEFAKMSIRTVTERIQAERKLKEKTEEEALNEDLETAIDKLSTGLTNNTASLIDYVEELRSRKAALVEEKGERLAEKLGTKWYNEGEKSTKYFLRLLNRASPDDFVSVEKSNGEKATSQEEIESEIVNFYKLLYEENTTITMSDEETEAFFKEIIPISVSDEDEITKAMSEEELRRTLHDCQDSAPGPDGIPYSIIGALWTTFGPVLCDAWRHSLVTGKLPPSHKTSYLKLIPKAGKDLNKLTNWRPITLSNCDHKLITKAYARRLSSKIGGKIAERQTAYLKGRLINDNIRAMLATVNLAGCEEDLKGLLISLDAKKAFDSVDHNYIIKCLEKFGCKRFVPIFKTLYSELSSDILINGKVVKGFNILRGVKQGDSLSCILFIMCMEPLLRNIENNNEVEQLHSTSLNCDLPKSYAYADDVNCTVKDSHRSVQAIFYEYERLTKISGLELNADKTEILRLGSEIETRYVVNYMGEIHRLDTKEKIKINGILFQRDGDRRRRENIEAVKEKITNQLKKWTRRSLSTIGKILILKTFGISQIIFLMQSMELKDADIKALNLILYKFIWNRHFQAPKAPERIKRSIMNTPVKLGGYGMLDIAELDKSLKIKAIGRLFTTNHPLLSILGNRLNKEDYFQPRLLTSIDSVATKGIEFLVEARQVVWANRKMDSNREIIAIIRKLCIKSIVNAVGQNSIPFYLLWRRGVRKVRDLDPNSLDSIARYIEPLKIPKLRLAVTVNTGDPQVETFRSLVMKDRLKPIDKCTSKEIREVTFTKSVITEFKIGLTLNRATSESWSYRLSKLTSARHRNALLKCVHGEVYTKEKLHRFGLIDSNQCPRCNQIDTLRHKIFECVYTKKIWEEFFKYDDKLTGTNLINEPIENKVFGALRQANIQYMTLAAEIIQRILYLKDDQNFLIRPINLVQQSIKTCARKERDMNLKEEFYSLLNA